MTGSLFSNLLLAVITIIIVALNVALVVAIANGPPAAFGIWAANGACANATAASTTPSSSERSE